MILVDTNLLIFASIATTEQHKKAKAWLDDQLNSKPLVGMPWPSLLGFLRIVTNPRVFDPPTTPRDAWKVVEYWLGCSTVWIPQPTEKHASVLRMLYQQTSPQGNLVPDAHLAALAIEHGLLLCSTDIDFAGFPELRWENPLENNNKRTIGTSTNTH
jgi:hypothetical protein